MGSYCSVMNNTQGTMYCKYGPNLGAAEIILIVCAAIGEMVPEGGAITLVATMGQAALYLVAEHERGELNNLSSNIDQWFKSRGYGARSPNTSYDSDKLSLSLIVSANCGLLTRIEDGKLELKIGSMTCWSAPTNNDTNRYNITDCSWARIDRNIRSSGIMSFEATSEQSDINLAEDKEFLAQVREMLEAKGHTFEVKPGVEPEPQAEVPPLAS